MQNTCRQLFLRVRQYSKQQPVYSDTSFKILLKFDSFHLKPKPSMPNWFYKYKVYHLLFWFGYHYMWWSIAIGSPMEAASNIFFSPYSTKFLFYVVFQAIGVYFNLYYLMPKYLETGKYAKYLVFVVSTVLVTAACIISGYYVTSYWTGLPFKELFGDTGFMKLLTTNSLPSTAGSMTLAMSIKLARNWIKAQKRQQLLEKEKLETELKFLKSQFNPHFLFNTINSIFVLIHKNPDMASASLAKFSDLMRYQLYECNEPKIPVERELDYLRNFIELGKLRLDETVQVDALLNTNGYSNTSIAPFILMPFVENAFKHVSQNKEQKNWLKIKLNFSGTGVQFEVANSISPLGYSKSDTTFENSGIGLKNVKRRLDLVYPNQYELEIEKTAVSYRVFLQLSLMTNELVSETVATP
ncbi:histidine kinase, partial [Maribacter sp.]|nr:histidine kinase [Maribacter sp.]